MIWKVFSLSHLIHSMYVCSYINKSLNQISSSCTDFTFAWDLNKTAWFTWIGFIMSLSMLSKLYTITCLVEINSFSLALSPPPLVSDPIRTDLQPTSWELLCPFTVINFLFVSLCSIWTVSGLRCRSWRKTAGRSVTSCGLILHLTACCVKPCSTTCPLSHLQPTLMTQSTPCPTSSSACSTTLMPQRCSNVSNPVLIF